MSDIISQLVESVEIASDQWYLMLISIFFLICVMMLECITIDNLSKKDYSKEFEMIAIPLKLLFTLLLLWYFYSGSVVERGVFDASTSAKFSSSRGP